VVLRHSHRLQHQLGLRVALAHESVSVDDDDGIRGELKQSPELLMALVAPEGVDD
jgi:hypothetical protein